MVVELSTGRVEELDLVSDALRDWQREDAPLQLHPGDLGWLRRLGDERATAAVRTWSRDDQLQAIGFLDGPEVFRMTVGPEVWDDEEVARQVVDDVEHVLPTGRGSVEAPDGTRVQSLLSESGWSLGEAWTPLRRDLSEPVPATELRVETVGSHRVSEFTAVVRSSFGSDRFTDDRWQTMAAATPYAEARSLLGLEGDTCVAAITVWSAGPGRPGLVEPMGVHVDHRGRGHGRAICLAGAAALRELGSSSVLVCTPSTLAGAVATYESAGFGRLPQRLDRTRPSLSTA